MIENRNLSIGTRLVATYKKQAYACTVEASEDGERNEFVLEDGKRFKSPSAAGSHVMGGGAVNGWRFWTLEGEAPAAGKGTEAKPTTTNTASAKDKKTIYRVPPGKVAEGKSKWFCVACMKSFVIEGSEAPAGCPEGHPMEDLHTDEVAS